jgi:hypothetical protein
MFNSFQWGVYGVTIGLFALAIYARHRYIKQLDRARESLAREKLRAAGQRARDAQVAQDARDRRLA